MEYPTVQRQTGEMAFVWLEMRGLNFDPGQEPLFIIILPAKATLCPTGQQDVRTHSGRKIGERVICTTSVRTGKRKYDS